MKKCNICKEEKEYRLFYKNHRAKDGHCSKCKSCYTEYENDPVNRKRRLHLQKRRRAESTKDRAKTILHTLRKSIKKRQLEFTLTADWIEEKLNNKTCEVTGIMLQLDSENCEHTVTTRGGRLLNPFSPSVDRVDNNKGYTPDNCKMVVAIYNYAKLTFNEESLKIFCQEYLKHNG